VVDVIIETEEAIKHCIKHRVKVETVEESLNRELAK